MENTVELKELVEASAEYSAKLQQYLYENGFDRETAGELDTHLKKIATDTSNLAGQIQVEILMSDKSQD